MSMSLVLFGQELPDVVKLEFLRHFIQFERHAAPLYVKLSNACTQAISCKLMPPPLLSDSCMLQCFYWG